MKTFDEAYSELRTAAAGYEICPSLAAESLNKAALDTIQALMSGKDWSPETLNTIADIVRLTGRPIEDSGEFADEDP